LYYEYGNRPVHPDEIQQVTDYLFLRKNLISKNYGIRAIATGRDGTFSVHDEVLCYYEVNQFSQLREFAASVKRYIDVLPKRAYRDTFDMELQTAASERQNANLTVVDSDQGRSTYWDIIVELFTQNGMVKRYDREVPDRLFENLKIDKRGFDRALTGQYGSSSGRDAWREKATGGGIHIRISDGGLYSLAW